jgi:DNA polymerase III subunit gamma/tau
VASPIEAVKVETPVRAVVSTIVEDKANINPPILLRQRPGSISITSSQEIPVTKPDNQVGEIASTVIQNQSFTLEDLEKSWYQFGETIPEQGRMMSLILSTKPVLLSSHEFEVTVSNFLQERELKKMQVNILEFVHEKLQNSLIKMTLKIAEETESTKSNSPEERYRKMAEQNSALTTLRNGLQMEID